MPGTLTPDQVKFYQQNGYIAPLPIFTSDEIRTINDGLQPLLDLLAPGESTKEIREWHETSRYLFEICMDDRILDKVESLLGGDFYLWASNFFIKEPRTHHTVAWHQDAYYWPLRPIESATVWLAFDDVDDGNGAMKVIPGSHHSGMVDHERLDPSTDSVLGLAADTSGVDTSSAVSISLKAGEISIHDDKLLHASPANPSDRRRAGFTIRYSPNRVVCDLSVNPHFRIYQARGRQCTINPIGTEPVERYGRLIREHKSVEEHTRPG